MHRESESKLPLEPLSELMDGESDAASTHRACCDWRDDPLARQQWHAWHLIGDVLRSDDLVCRPQRDAAFVAALRSRLASEPVVLAPEPMTPAAEPVPASPAVTARRFRRSASGAAAIAAGFVVVAGTLVAMRPTTPEAPRLAQGTAAGTAQGVAAGVPVNVAPLTLARNVEPQVQVANGKLIRDARLDQYLAAHKRYSPLGMPTSLTQGRPVETAATSR